MKMHPARKSRRKFKSDRPIVRARGRVFETLEGRAMLASDAYPWQNPFVAEDVNGDFLVTPADVVKLIDALNRNGISQLDASASTVAIRGTNGPITNGNASFLDVTGDGLLTPNDLVTTLAKVNRAVSDPDDITITAGIFDVAGNPITEVTAGTDFMIGLIAEDARSTGASGVLAAYADIELDANSVANNLASFNSGPLSSIPSLQFDSAYGQAQVGTIDTANGLVNDAGAFANSSTPPPFPDPVVIWTTKMRANSAGTLTFTPSASEDVEFNDLLLYNPVNVGDTADPLFVDGTLNVVSAAAPSLSIDDVTIVEGNSGTTNAVFTVTISAPRATETYIIYTTTDGSAIAGSDYTASGSGTMTIAANATTGTITVPVLGDTIFEGDETFNVNLLFATDATIADGVGLGTITDDDTAPQLSVNDQTVTEGDAGTIDMVFTVTLSPASTVDVIVGFNTVGNTATAGQDFIAQSGQLTFAPGETSKTITVPIIGDLLSEGVETFFLNLSSPVNAVISDSQGVGTIIDNDAQGFSVSDTTVLEGDSGTTDATFIVSLSSPQAIVTTVVFSTGAGGDTATTADNDYQPTTGTLTFAPGQTQQSVVVAVNGDTTIEPDEFFTVTLSNPTNTVLLNPTGTGNILDDDGAHPTIMTFRFEVVDDSNVVIPSGGSIGVGQNFTLNVYVDESATDFGVFLAYLDVLYSSALIGAIGPISFNPIYDNSRSGNFGTDGIINEAGAFDGSNPLGPAELLLFSIPMVTESSGVANFFGDPSDSPDPEVIIYDGVGLQTVPLNQIDYGSYTLNIGANSFQIDDVSQNEGDAGTTNMVFTVTRFNPDNTEATVVFNTSEGTATIGDSDYVGTSGTLTFGIGVTTQTISVPINGDTKNETDETFTVTLSNPVSATIGQGTGTGTIVNDDAAPTVSINDVSGAEGTNLVFTVSLSGNATSQQITVPFSTAADAGPNAATPGTDFTSTSGVITFAPGVTSQNISVAALADLTTPEANETFLVQLGSPSLGTIGDGTGVGTIIDAPPAGITGFVYVDADNDGIKDANEVGIGGAIVTLTSEDGSVTLTDVTDTSGVYQFLSVPAGKYFVTETQPGFYIDGSEIPAPFPSGVLLVANDQYSVDLTVNPAVTGLNFGEKGILPELLAVALNRRIYFASTINGGVNGIGSPIVNMDLTRGDIWISFDAGWDGLRKFQAYFASGNVSLKLYDIDRFGKLHQLAASSLVNGIPEIAFTDSPDTNPKPPLFLQISGTSANASVKIIDTLRVVAQSIVEDSTNATLTVKLSGPQTAAVTVQYATANNSATAGADYTATSGTLTFAAGETEKTITVPILEDLLDEDNETFLVNLTNASSFVEVAPGTFNTTITDEDQPPKLNIGDVVIAEGDGGSTNAVFNVILSSPSGRQVTVAYTTAGGTATSNGDFTAVSGTLTFAAGVIAQQIAVPILGDTFLEGDESFSVLLASPTNANILDGVGVGSITNDDAGPQFIQLSLPAGESTSGFLAYTESSDGTSSGSSSTAGTSSLSTADSSGSYSSRTASRGRTASSAVDAALEEEDDWSLVA